jgi:hypothetical protein
MGTAHSSKHLYVFTNSGVKKLFENYGFDFDNDQLAAFNTNDIIRKHSASSAQEELLKSYDDLTVEEARKVIELIAEMKKARSMRINKYVSTIQLNLVRINDLLKFFTEDGFDSNAKESYSVTLDGLIGFGFELFNEIQNLKNEF